MNKKGQENSQIWLYLRMYCNKLICSTWVMKLSGKDNPSLDMNQFKFVPLPIRKTDLSLSPQATYFVQQFIVTAK